jgi:hypothetical protein
MDDELMKKMVPVFMVLDRKKDNSYIYYAIIEEIQNADDQV